MPQTFLRSATNRPVRYSAKWRRSGLVAIADEGRATPLSSAGTLNALYAQLSPSNVINGTYFFDVTSGSSGSYSAGPGYDLVTGLGSPHANQLIPDLRGASGMGGVHSDAGSTAPPPLQVVAVPLGDDGQQRTGLPVGLTAGPKQELAWAAAVGVLGQPPATANSAQPAGTPAAESLPRTDSFPSTLTFVLPATQRGHADDSESWPARRNARRELPEDAEG
jgi:hypothetical protein